MAKTAPVKLPNRRLTARQILRLPMKQRDQILAAAAAKAEEEYTSNKSLTQFEAFGEDDLYADSSSTEAR